MNMRWTSGEFSPPTERRSGTLFYLTAGVLTLALILGGASRENPWQAMTIELASLPLLVAAGLATMRSDSPRRYTFALVLVALVLVVPLLQLLPLPFDVWRKLPGRSEPALALDLAGVKTGWRAISLDPRQTFGDFLALIPAAAVFLATTRLSPTHRRWLALPPVLIAVLSLMIGAGQIAGGQGSPLYFYETTNPDSAVGLFSNRNHQAALLLAALPLVALWIDLRGGDPRRRLIPAAAALAVLTLVILGLVIVKSRAGVLLLAPSLIASMALIWRGEAGAHRRILVGVVVGASVLVFAASIFALGPLLERFGGNEVEGRLTTAPVVIGAALAHFPLGSGLGTFVPVFAGREPIETMGPAFWNHAHNDYLELWLEAGVLGLIVLTLFLGWWAVRAFSAWRAPPSLAAACARSGVIVTALLMVHSTVDYPLRSLALSTLFAFACGLMVPPGGAFPSAPAPARDGRQRRVREDSAPVEADISIEHLDPAPERRRSGKVRVKHRTGTKSQRPSR